MLQGEILRKLHEIDDSDLDVTEWEGKFLSHVFDKVEVKGKPLSPNERDKAQQIIETYAEKL